MTGSLPRKAARSRPTASSAFEGTATCQPTPCTQATSLVWLCQGSPHLKKPPGMRTTMGAAKRLRVRQRSVPQSLSCSAAGSAYLRNWISATGRRPASAMPTARPTMPSSDRLVSKTRTVLVLKTQGCAVHAAFRPHVLPENQHARIERKLRIERATDRRQHVDARRLGARLHARVRERKALGQI